MPDRENIFALLRSNLTYIQDDFGVKNLAVFGSWAKGNPSETSDIDLIVEFNKPIGLKFMDLIDYLENSLKMKVDLLTPAGINSIRNESIKKSILENVIYV